MTAADVCDQMRAEGFAPFAWTDGPGTVYPPHQHAHDECLWMVSGSMEFDIGGQTLLLSAGEKLVLPRNTVHAARVKGPGRAHYVIGQR